MRHRMDNFELLIKWECKTLMYNSSIEDLKHHAYVLNMQLKPLFPKDGIDIFEGRFITLSASISF